MTEHERKLEREMLEAATAAAETVHLEKDPFLIILYRLNHQDRTLAAIKGNVDTLTTTVEGHIARETEIKDSIDEMVVMWKGSKLAGRIVSWLVGIASAIGATWVAMKKGFL